MDCLVTCKTDECGYRFCELCEPLHDHPKKQVVARIDASERRLDPEPQAAGSRALMGGLSGRARERIERGS
eukprot:44332-Alexandrium_andersonii.AAC.1